MLLRLLLLLQLRARLFLLLLLLGLLLCRFLFAITHTLFMGRLFIFI